MNEIEKVERKLKIEMFLKEHRKFAYDLDELSKLTGLKNLTHKELFHIEDIERATDKDGTTYYHYKPLIQQLQECLDQLVGEGKITVEEVGDKRYYQIV